MTTKYVAPGNAVQAVMPYAVNSGDGVQVGATIFGVAQNTYASGASGIVLTEGAFTGLAKASGTGEAWAVGDRLFWDNSGKKLTKNSTGNIQVAVAWAAVGTAVTTAGLVKLDSVTPSGT